MIDKKIDERRNTERAKHVLSIQFRLIKTTRKICNKDWHLSTTQDMSAGGLSFNTNQDFRPGDVLDVHVVMSGVLDIYKGKGEVVRVSKKKTGVHSLVGIKYYDESLKKRSAKRHTTTTAKKPTKRSAKRI